MIRRFVEEHPSIALTMSIIGISTMLYLGSEGLSVLRPDHWLTSFFYGSFTLMILYTFLSKLRSNDTSQEFLVRYNIFLWFSTTLLGSRMAVRVAEIGNPANPTGNLAFIPFNQLWVGGYHIHHYVFGLLLITSATMLLLERPDFPRVRAGIMFGAGLGLLFDEIGFLLSMGNYSSLLTYPLALIMAFTLFLNAYRPWQ